MRHRGRGRQVALAGDRLAGDDAALRREAGFSDLPFPGGAARVAQAVDADLLARAIAYGWQERDIAA